HQKTTHGVDVVPWKFKHPDYPDDIEKDITLNIWDFEGQEITHQSHQFFLTKQALYLLVFRCRDQFLMERAEYWLDTIRARAPKAKVAIVITECEKRTPYVPLDRLQALYGDLLADKQWFFTVGCESGLNIEKLQEFLKRWATDLEFMGRPWPISYDKAEKKIKARAKAKKQAAHISRKELYEIFKESGIDENNFEDAATALSTLGIITQFPDCPDLSDFIVLRPQWLTKAISRVMEDSQLYEDKGEIVFDRMDRIWKHNGYSGMFATFHNCMKEFELCYDMENASQGCLVPLRFGYIKPPIPWSSGEAMKERSVEYKLNIRPPMGIMSRFIVKTHHMIVKTDGYPKGVYWHNGAFLRTGEGPLASEALCEFDNGERKLRIQVRAAFPQNLIEQIHAYVKAVFSFFSGLEAERSYGCIKVGKETNAEQLCAGLHTEKRIFSEILNENMLNCEFGMHKIDPKTLIWGISSFGENVQKLVPIEDIERLFDKQPKWAAPLFQSLDTLILWTETNRQKLDQLLQGQADLLPEIKQEMELKLHEYLSYISQMLDDRDFISAPGIFSISIKDRNKWDPNSYFTKTYVLTPFCESYQNIHPCEDGRVEFTKYREWWEKTAPLIARGIKVLSVGLQLAFAGMPLAMGDEVFKGIKNDVEFMKELAKNIPLTAVTDDNSSASRKIEMLEGSLIKDLRNDNPETRLTRAALTGFLEEVAPEKYNARQWGSLRRVRMRDNSYRWLCEKCAAKVRK
ncbi:MAG TPA: COR domain-containing protein, partial [Thermoguttaceae bacterium]